MNEDPAQPTKPFLGSLSSRYRPDPVRWWAEERVVGELASGIAELFGTSISFHGPDGDCEALCASSPWCARLDGHRPELSLCREAHREAARAAIRSGVASELSCPGGLRTYAVAVRARGEVVGAVVFGYGEPPAREAEIEAIAGSYGLCAGELSGLAARHPFSPPALLGTAKTWVSSLAAAAGAVVEARLLRGILEIARRVLEEAPDATLVVDRRGEILFASNAVERLLGYRPAELLGRRVEELIPEPLRGLHARYRADYLLDPRPRPMGGGKELLALRRDGKAVPVEIALSPVEAGDKVFVAVALRDVAERRRMAEALRESDRRYRELFERVPIGLYRTSPDGTIEALNPAAARLFGYEDPAELLGRSAAELYADPGERERWTREVERAGQAVAEMLFCDRSGRSFWLRDHGRAVRDPNGRLVAYEGSLEDVTARRLAEEEARSMAKLRSAFLANMSHEIRTPLNVILGLADVVEERLAELGDASLSPLFGASRRAAARLLRTIQNVLELAQLEAGTLRANPAWLRIAEVVERLRQEFEPRAREKGLGFAVSVGVGAGSELWCDERCLALALENLLDNAVKFTLRGEVTLRLARGPGGGLEFEIRDTGVGIAAEHRARLFEPFLSQEEVGPDRPFEGLGLGLALAKRVLELDGAELSAESAKGLGSVFRIRFSGDRVRP